MKIYSIAFLLLFQFTFAGNKTSEFPASSPITDSQQEINGNKSGAANIVFKSADGGQTWQDVSEGLPENLQEDDIQGDDFFANDGGLYLSAGNEIYHNSKPNSSSPFWNKEAFPCHQGNIAPGKNGIFAYSYADGRFLQKTNGSSEWLPMYPNFREKEVRTVFETAEGTVFIGSDKGLFRSTDSGKSWRQIQSGGWAMKLVESNGVLMATSQGGILRSADGGEHWDLVISEGGVGIAIERIGGGFAAITYNTVSKTRRVRTSYDGGRTWFPIDAGLPPSLSIASIVHVGEDFFCGHPAGIFRSSDKGKTWKLLLPSIENKVYNLSVSGNVLYAIPRAGGC